MKERRSLSLTLRLNKLLSSKESGRDYREALTLLLFTPLQEQLCGVFKRGISPSFNISSPSPLKERGIKGVRLINNI